MTDTLWLYLCVRAWRVLTASTRGGGAKASKDDEQLKWSRKQSNRLSFELGLRTRQLESGPLALALSLALEMDLPSDGPPSPADFGDVFTGPVLIHVMERVAIADVLSLAITCKGER